MSCHGRLIRGLLALELALTLLGRGLISAIEVSVRQVTFHTDVSNQVEMAHLSNILDALEQLGVLESSPKTCYNLDRIVKVQEAVENGWKVNIELQIQEVSELEDNGKVTSGLDIPVQCAGQGIPIHWTPSTGSDHVTLRQGTSQDALPSNNGSPVDESGNFTTDIASVTQKNEGTLSLAQIMVISSCSIVIGLFFIVALIMRIRNCVKRRRELKARRRTAYRSSSFKVGKTHNAIASTSSSMNPRAHHQHINMAHPVKANTEIRVPVPVDQLQWYEREYLLSM